MVLESVAAAAKEIAEKAMESAKEIIKDGVEHLPEQIGELSEAEDLPDEIGGELETDELPDEIGDEMPAESQENVNDAEDNGNTENTKETDAPEKKGGRYADVCKDAHKEGEKDKYEVHHMPAKDSSNLKESDGPAIRMEKADHRQTASCGNSKEAMEYRAQQKELIEQGKFREAVQMDIDDIRAKFGDKYDDAINEMLEYVDKLEAEGKIDG